jgi:predicted enzyme related to lactoylglutathione lyase
MKAGRMAILIDRIGAQISVWQAGEHIGAGVANEPNSLGWNELGTREPQQAMDFYGDLFGWTFQDVGSGYHEIKSG